MNMNFDVKTFMIRSPVASTIGNDDNTSLPPLLKRSPLMSIKLLAALLFSLLLSTIACASEFDELSKKLPRGANAVLVIDVTKALASPMAKKNDWGKRMNDGSAPVYLPQESDKVIVAAQFDPVRQFASEWEVAVIGLTEALPMRLVAKAEGGYTDTISGLNAAWVPSDAYFIEMAPLIMGVLSPANRQAVSRWARRQKERSVSEVSEYLAKGIRRVKDGGPQFVLALDLQGVVQPHRVHQRLSQSDIIKKHNLSVDDVADVVSSIEGLILEITITDKATAKVQIEFNKPVTFNKTVAKELVLGALASFHAELPGVEEWKVTAGEKLILCSGDVSPAALRRILSMLEIPTTKFSSLKGQNTEEASGDDMTQNSLAYFKSITSLVEELEKNSKSNRDDIHWIDRYAKKIDRLPILHVDPDLLTFGEKTVETLRIMSGTKKRANLTTGVEKANIATSGIGDGGYGGGYGNYSNGYGGAGYSSTSRSRARTVEGLAATQRNTAAASANKIQGFTLIDDATSKMRRTMTERYNIEF
jgi:hypothetical protein